MNASPFFFQAAGASPGEVALAIADHYAVSVLVHESVSGRVSGRLVAASLEQALDAFGFLIGEDWRQDDTGRLYYFGGKESKEIAVVPSYGLTAAEAGSLTGDGHGVRLVADKLVLQGDKSRLSDVRRALESFSSRPSILLEIMVVDVSTNTVERVNAWLDAFKVGAGFVAKSAEIASNVSNPVGQLATKGELTYDVNLSALFQLLEGDSSARVQLRQQTEILSGANAVFEAGDVQSTPLIIREPETGRDLVTAIERRTIGLSVDLRATALESGWQIEVELEDSGSSNGRETATKFRGQRRIADRSGPVLLCSFSRRANEAMEREVPGLGRAPKVGRWFRKKETLGRERSVMVLVRPMSVTR